MVEGLGAGAVQGDARYAGLLERMGAVVETGSPDRPGTLVVGPIVLRPILADLAPMPDTAMSLAVAACFAPGTSVIRGLKTLRIKETDRIEALRVELGKIGVTVEVGVQGDDETITITPPASRCAAKEMPALASLGEETVGPSSPSVLPDVQCEPTTPGGCVACFDEDLVRSQRLSHPLATAAAATHELARGRIKRSAAPLASSERSSA